MVDVVVTYDYTADEEDEMSIKQGDTITDVIKHDGGWWEGTLNGKRGMFPDNFVKDMPKKEKVREPSSRKTSGGGGGGGGGSGHVAQLTAKLGGIKLGPPSTGKKNDVGKKKIRGKVTFNYTPENDDEIKMSVGETIEITKQEEEGWWEGRTESGKEGMFPSNFVDIIVDEEDKQDKSEEETQEFHEIKGKKAKGIGFGNIFGGGPITLRKTQDETHQENNKSDPPPLMKTKKANPPQPVTEDAPALPPKQEPRETKSFSGPGFRFEAETGNRWPVTPPSGRRKSQYFFVMNGESMMTCDDESPYKANFEYGDGPLFRDNGDMPMGVMSPKDDSMDADEVPLNLSALSQTRETPPLRKTFNRRRRSKGAREAKRVKGVETPDHDASITSAKSPVYTITEEAEHVEGAEPETHPADDSGSLSSEYEPNDMLYETKDMMDDSDLGMGEGIDRSRLQLLLMKSPSDPCLYHEKYNYKKRVSFSGSQACSSFERKVGSHVGRNSILKNTPPKEGAATYLTPPNIPLFHIESITDSVKLMKQRRSLLTSPESKSFSEDKGTQCCFEDGPAGDAWASDDEEEADAFAHVTVRSRPITRGLSLRESFTNKLRTAFTRRPSFQEKSSTLPRSAKFKPDLHDFSMDSRDVVQSSYTLPKNAKLLQPECGGGDLNKSVVSEILKELMKPRDADASHDVPAKSPPKRGFRPFGRSSRKVTPEVFDEDQMVEVEDIPEEKEEYVAPEKPSSYLEHMIHSGRVAPAIQRLALKYEIFGELHSVIDNKNNSALDTKEEPTSGQGNGDSSVASIGQILSYSKDMSNISFNSTLSDPIYWSLLVNNDVNATGDSDKMFSDASKSAGMDEPEGSSSENKPAAESVDQTGRFADAFLANESDYEKRLQAIHDKYMSECMNEGLFPKITDDSLVAKEAVSVAEQIPVLSDDVAADPMSSTTYDDDLTSGVLVDDPTNEGIEAAFAATQEGDTTAAEGEFGKQISDPPEDVAVDPMPSATYTYEELAYTYDYLTSGVLVDDPTNGGIESAFADPKDLISAQREFAEQTPILPDDDAANRMPSTTHAYDELTGGVLVDDPTYEGIEAAFAERIPADVSADPCALVEEASGVLHVNDRMNEGVESAFGATHEDDLMAAEREFLKLSEAIDSYPNMEYHFEHMQECEKKWQELAKKATPSKLRRITDRMLSLLKSPFKNIHPLGVVGRVAQSNSLSSIEELPDDSKQSLLSESKNDPRTGGPSVVPLHESQPHAKSEDEFVAHAKQIVADVFAQISLQQSIRRLNSRVVLVDDCLMEGGAPETSGRAQVAVGSAASPAAVWSGSSVAFAFPGPFTFHSMPESPESFFDASDLLASPPVVNVSVHEEIRKECNELWRQKSNSKLGQSPASVSEKQSDGPIKEEPHGEVSGAQPGVADVKPKRQAPVQRKKRFIDRLRRRSCPYPPTSEFQEPPPAESEFVDMAKRKGSMGIMKRLSLRRDRNPASSTPKKSDDKPEIKSKGKSLRKRFSLRKSKPFVPEIEAYPLSSAEALPIEDIADDTKKTKKMRFPNIFRRLTLRRERAANSSPVPEDIASAVINSQVDQSLEPSEASTTVTATGATMVSHNKAASVMAMHGSCSSWGAQQYVAEGEEPAVLPPADTSEMRSDDTSITFSTSSLLLPDNTKSPMTREIYRKLVVSGMRITQPVATSPESTAAERPSLAIDSFTFGDSSASFQEKLTVSGIEYDFDEHLLEDKHAQSREVPDARCNLYRLPDAPERAGPMWASNADTSDFTEVEMNDAIASLICPIDVPQDSPLYGDDATDGYRGCRGDAAGDAAEVSVDDVSFDLSPGGGSPRVCGAARPRLPPGTESADRGTGSPVSMTDSEVAELINMSDVFGPGMNMSYYSITSGSLTPSVKTESQSESGSTPVSPATQSEVSRFKPNGV